ncbi:hypothetical protein Mth01_01730 [Sphaerimonospora thailandensis]|uniref:Uncharacterized protein n=1 Tax=Sphaerimonospora thailandensis TaxID=795644 RepID=A0A8J3R547_9ACTN|nr:hypothetical protein Mth01_01730 [Sphaerimonospora thailandensis]
MMPVCGAGGHGWPACSGRFGTVAGGDRVDVVCEFEVLGRETASGVVCGDHETDPLSGDVDVGMVADLPGLGCHTHRQVLCSAGGLRFIRRTDRSGGKPVVRETVGWSA